MPAVHQTRPAGQAGQWLQSILEPVVEACRFDHPLPVEIRPTGDWAGWCAGKTEAKDGRVCMSSRIVFWTSEKIISTYLHESAHRLLSWREAEVPHHGAVFFALNSLLLSRCKSFFKSDYQFAEMSFYDLQDRPEELLNFPNWQEICLRFTRETKAAFSEKTCSAEELSALVVYAWPKFLAKLEAEQKVKDKVARTIKNLSLISAEREKYIARLEGWLLKIIATVFIAFLVTMWAWLR